MDTFIIITLRLFAFASLVYLAIWCAWVYFYRFNYRTSHDAWQHPRKLWGFELHCSESTKTAIAIILLAIGIRLILHVAAHFNFAAQENQRIDLLDSFQRIWLRWDAHHYLTLAREWYKTTGDKKNLLAFYPAYPALIHAVTWLVGSEFHAAMLISYVAIALASLRLYQFMMMEFNSEKAAWTSVILVNVYPWSFFFGMPYTESIFFLFSVNALYYMRKHNWWTAGVFGLLAATTRNHGALLAIPFVMEVIHHNRSMDTPVYERSIKNLISGLSASCLIWVGIGLYLLLNYSLHGDPFAFLDIQKSNWHNEFSFYVENLEKMYKGMNSWEVKMTYGTWWPTLVMFVFSTSVLLLGRKILPLSLTFYGVCYVFISYSPSTLLSGPRYLSNLIPMFMILGVLAKDSEKYRTAMVVVSTVFMFAFVNLFICGGVF